MAKPALLLDSEEIRHIVLAHLKAQGHDVDAESLRFTVEGPDTTSRYGCVSLSAVNVEALVDLNPAAKSA